MTVSSFFKGLPSLVGHRLARILDMQSVGAGAGLEDSTVVAGLVSGIELDAFSSCSLFVRSLTKASNKSLKSP